MACCLSFSAWQHLSFLNTLWNVEKWFGFFMTVAFALEELSVYLNTAQKEVLVFLGFPLAADPKGEESVQGRDITEAWLSAGRSVINLGSTTVPEPLPKCWTANQTQSILVTTLMSFSTTLSHSQFQIHQSSMKASLYLTGVLMQLVICPCYNIYCQ